MSAPVRLSWELPLPVPSRSAAWRVFADTDSFNRAAGLGFSFEEGRDDEGRVHRIGVAHRFGLTLKWIDEPFQMVAPEWFRSVRRFLNGPLATLVTTVRLRRTAEGVHLSYTVDLTPRHWALRPVVLLDARTSIAPLLERTLHAAASQLGDDPAPFDVPPPLSPDARALVGRLDDLATGGRLADLLHEAPLKQQDRLRPLALARAWKVEPDVVLGDLLQAVERGVLELRFDLICPSCHGAKHRRDRFDLSPEQVHCPSCEIRYDASFPDSVEVSFRPTPEVRPEPVPLDCVHSPSHTPHVCARTRIGADDEVAWRAHLKPGAYRLLREGDARGAALEVRAGLRQSAVAVDLTAEGVVPPVLRVGPGTVEIAVRNTTDRPASVVLQQRWRPPDTLTVGRLLERPGMRARLPAGALPPGLGLTTRAVGLLVVDGRADPDALDRLADRVRPGDDAATIDLDAAPDGPLATWRADGCWLAAFPHAQAALDAARRLLPAPRLALALDVGVVTLITDEGRVQVAGAVADRAIDAARHLGVGRLGLPAEALDDPGLSAALTRAGLEPRRPPGSPLAWLRTPAPPPDPDAAPPEVVGGRYALAEEIGRGGMGVVRAATDRQTGQAVVVKALLPDFAVDPSHVQRFFWEARAASRIDHPHTVRVFDHGLDGAVAWLVMERLHGVELRDRLRERPRLPLEQVIPLALDVLDGLAAAHDAGVVHRDVKPANLFLCQQPRPDHPKIVDFGIAITVEDELDDPDDVVLGTPRYLAPEQVERLPLDGRADVYALGLVLYEALSGDIPFAATDARALAFARLVHDPAPLRDVAPEVPAPVAEVIMRALQGEREDRWPSARAMADALRAALDEVSASAAP